MHPAPGFAVVHRPDRVAPAPARRAPTGDDASLSAMWKAILTALAQHRSGLTKRQLLIHAGYAASGKVSSAFAELTRRDWIFSDGGVVGITGAGEAALGPYEPLPSGKALRDHVIKRASTMEGALLEVLFAAYPGSLSKGEILQAAGYAASGKVSSAFAKLTRLNYAVKAPGGRLVAGSELYE